MRHRYFSDGMVFLGLLLTRVLPYAWYVRCHQPSAGDLAAAKVDFTIQKRECVVSINGEWTQQNFERLRTCFKTVAATEQDIRLNIMPMVYVDSAFIGLVILLYKSQQGIGRILRIVGAQKKVQSVSRWSCEEFLLK